MRPLAALAAALPTAAAWNDIAGALTYRGVHHVWQGCPASKQQGWHHAASVDLVRWQDRGINIAAMDESWEGFKAARQKNSPCSGFETVDDEGVPCAGFRQCSSTAGTTELNPAAQPWDAPLELRCATNANLTRWSSPEYIFPVYYNRGLPYDPTRPWKVPHPAAPTPPRPAPL